MNHFQQVKSFILNHGSHVKWLSNVSLFIANAVDTSEMRFLKEKKRLPSFFLQYWPRYARECEFWNFDKIKNKNNNKTKKKQKKTNNFWLDFCLNKECTKLLCGLDIGHRRRQTISMWNSSGGKGILHKIIQNRGLLSVCLSVMKCLSVCLSC